MKVFAALLIALLVATGCSGGSPEAGEETSNTGPSSGNTGGGTVVSTGPAPETTQGGGTTNEAPGSFQIEQVSSGSDGLKRPQVVVAPSADALSEATGLRVPNSGEGTYLAAFWGEKPTGGYTVEVSSARMEDNQVTVRLVLQNPPPDAMVGQALTYPYAAAIIRGGVPENTNFTLVTQGGRSLDWPIRRA